MQDIVLITVHNPLHSVVIVHEAVQCDVAVDNALHCVVTVCNILYCCTKCCDDGIIHCIATLTVPCTVCYSW